MCRFGAQVADLKKTVTDAGADGSLVTKVKEEAAGAGVEILAWRTRMSTGEFVLDAPVPVVLP